MIKPLVSIILAVHNEENFITKTLDSILHQTFKDFELIVINDCSKDKTGEILKSYASSDPRIKVIKNETCMGLARSLNKGIEISEAKYIARIDAGDIAEKSRLEKQVKYMEEFSDVSVLGSWAYLIDIKGEVIGEWRVPEEVNARILYMKNGVVHPTVLIRKELFSNIGKYNFSFKHAEDYELWARALKNKAKLMNLQEFLTFVSQRAEGVTRKHFKGMRKDTFRIKLKYLPYFFSIQNLLSTLRSLLGYILPTSISYYLSNKYAKALADKMFKKNKF
ncbi:MAG: glycosyltransferase [Candidatus Omnitrophota bacterium]